MPEIRECVSCGAEYVAKRSNHLRCRRNCRSDARGIRAATRPAGRRPTVFVGVDGEGVTDPDGRHRYVLLSVGTHSIAAQPGEELGTLEIFQFLWDCFVEDPVPAYVGFFLGYDFTQWLKGLPEERARMLLTPEGEAKRRRKDAHGNFPVYWEGWEFDLLAGRRLRLRPQGSKKWLSVCDVGGYFQASFLSVINPKGWDKPIVSDDEYNTIAEGKARRSTATYDNAMVRYNVLENIILARLMERLADGLGTMGIHLGRAKWFGPGQAAQEWLTNIKAPSREAIEYVTPPWALEIGQASYYGGWFEIPTHGHVNCTAHEYDINSAYPYAISELPDFSAGMWVQGTNHDYRKNRSPYQLVDVTVTGDNSSLGAMPHRTSKGRILRPHITRGIYWTDEIAAAVRAGLITSTTIHRWYAFLPDNVEARPYRAIVDLYHDRIKVGKNSPHGKALKIVYNSAYGKMAQSVGVPHHASSFAASRITSTCRRMILEAIATHPDKAHAVLMIATDGVYFDSKHPSLEVDSQKLGAWDYKTKEGLTLFMPGVYWDDESRERIRSNRELTLKSRGVNAEDLAKQIFACDRLFSKALGSREWVWPELTVSIRFDMVSARLACARNAWPTAGTIRTHDAHGNPITKSLSSDPITKRVVDGGTLYRGRYVSNVYPNADTLTSTPYSGRFGLEDSEVMGPEGFTLSQELRHIIHGS